MQEALDAIDDIVEALEEFGTAIKLRTIVSTGYDPMTGSTGETITDTTLKAIIKSEASESTERAFNSDYELSIMFYSTVEPTKSHKIVLGTDVYNILYVSKSILQGVTFKYEVLCAK